MKVKMPMFSVEARGAIGGLIYNTWRGINYVKTNTSPTGQGTEKRLDAQALLIAVAKLWATAGDINRAAWNQYATDHPVTNWTGTPERLTGMNWFVRCNVTLVRMGLSAVMTAPLIAAPDPITGFAVTNPADYIQVAWTTPQTGSYKLDWFGVGPISAGIAPKIQRCKWLGFQNPTDFAGAILITPSNAGRYTIFGRVLSTVTGLSSSWVSDWADGT
jgi:hypothetical protein